MLMGLVQRQNSDHEWNLHCNVCASNYKARPKSEGLWKVLFSPPPSRNSRPAGKLVRK